MNKVIRFTRLITNEPRGIGHIALAVAVTSLLIIGKIVNITVLVVKEPRDAGRMIVVLAALVVAAAIMPPHVKK